LLKKNLQAIIFGFNKFCISSEFNDKIAAYRNFHSDFPEKLVLVGGLSEVENVYWKLQSANLETSKPWMIDVYTGDEPCVNCRLEDTSSIRINLNYFGGDVKDIEFDPDDFVVQCGGWRTMPINVYDRFGVRVGPVYEGGVYRVASDTYELLDYGGQNISGIYCVGMTGSAAVSCVDFPNYGGEYPNTIWNDISKKAELPCSSA